MNFGLTSHFIFVTYCYIFWLSSSRNKCCIRRLIVPSFVSFRSMEKRTFTFAESTISADVKAEGEG